MNESHLSVAVSAAMAGARELMSRRRDRVVREKAPKDLVTDADLASQAAIRSVLMQAFAGYGFVGEEQGQTDPPDSVRRADVDAPPCWIVDPLDGTVNYVHGLQSFAVSIALFADGKMRLGVIYDPVTEQLFTAIDGRGAKCNDHPLSASGCTRLDEALIACSFPAGVKREDPEVHRFVSVLEQCQSLRRLGSCALNMCYVAAGSLDAYWATNVSAWDSAAGTVIAREAGAVLTAYDGAEFEDWNPKFCLAATPQLHQSLVTLLSDTLPASVSS
jgi:myo-inositol-1(or 4)-monophosphatase